jgi:hypothetical protein
MGQGWWRLIAVGMWEADEHGVKKLSDTSENFCAMVAPSLVQSNLPRHHGDPFDRLIVAQAIIEQVPIISAGANLDAYGITRIW